MVAKKKIDEINPILPFLEKRIAQKEKQIVERNGTVPLDFDLLVKYLEVRKFYTDNPVTVVEKIVEVEKPVIVEKIIEVPVPVATKEALIAAKEAELKALTEGD